MKFVIAFFSLFFTQLSVNGQMADSVKSAITTLLLEKKVADKVFYNNYTQDDWKNERSKLPDGRYAFIYPDTLFQDKYNGILREVMYADSINGVAFKREFYKNSVQAIYISWNLFKALVIIFKKIDITSETATIDFYTSSAFDQTRFVDRYIEVAGYLHKKNNRWRVVKYKIKPSKWIQYSRKRTLEELYKK